MGNSNATPISVQPGKPKLGELPVGWRIAVFGDALKLAIRPAKLANEIEYKLVNAKRNRGGIVLRSSSPGKRIKTKTQFIVAAGDFLISRRQIAHGACGVVPPELDGAIVSNEYAVFQPKPGVSLDFFRHLTHSIYFQQTCFHASVGVAVEKLIFRLEKWLLTPVFLPPLSEQEHIAAILSTWDAAILTSERLLAERQKERTSLRRLLLSGKMRHHTFVKLRDRLDTPVGDMPADWQVIRLDKVVTRIKRKNTVSETHVLTASGEHGLVDQKEFFDRTVAGKNLSGYYLLKRGEFAYNRSAMNGYPFGAIKRLDLYEQGVLSTLYICFGLAQADCDSDFMSHYFESGLLDRQLGEVTQVGGRAHGLLNITNSDFYSMQVVLPSLDEQKAIASILNTQDRVIELLQKKLDALRRQKKGLMQQLLTGKVRVKVTEPSGV